MPHLGHRVGLAPALWRLTDRICQGLTADELYIFELPFEDNVKYCLEEGLDEAELR